MKEITYCPHCETETVQHVTAFEGEYVRWCQECFHVRIVSDDRMKKRPGDIEVPGP